MGFSAKRIPFISPILFVTATLLIAGAYNNASFAQDQEGRYTQAWRGEPLADVLEEFSTMAMFPLSFDPLLVDGKRVFCVSQNQSVTEVLNCILVGSGLDFIIRSSGTFVIVPRTQGDPLFGNLRGIVVDEETEQPVSNAHILLVEASDVEHGRTANQNGIFLFSELLPGSYAMTVSHLGYKRATSIIKVEAGADKRTVVTLRYQAIPVTPIVIDGIGMQPSSTLLGSSVSSQAELTNALEAGTAGILRGIDAMPGVRVNDATADIHIQGGEAGEHQFRLDGAPVFIPLNVARIIGPFSPFALGKITVHKAGFGVSLGSQIAGIIEAEHDLSAPIARSGSRVRNRLVFQIDPLSSNARFNASWSRPDGFHVTYMSAARIGMWELSAPPSLKGLLNDWNTIDTFLLSAFAERNTPFANLPPKGQPSIGFFDWHNALKIRLNGLRTLYISSYWGSSHLGNDLSNVDLLGEDGPEQSSSTDLSEFKDVYRWQNGTGQARYEAVLGPTTWASIQTRASFYRLRHDFMAPDDFTLDSAEDDGNRVFELALDATLEFLPRSGRHDMEFGADFIFTDSRFFVAGTQLLPLNHTSSGWRSSFYVQNKLQLGRHTLFETGARITYLNSRQTLYFEPRMSARFDWQDTSVGGVSLFVGTGLYRQFVSQFDISSRSPRTFVSSTRFWMGTDHSVEPPKAGHLAAELLIIPSDKWSFRVESHYKKLYHVLSLDYSADVTDPSLSLDQASFLKPSHGYSFGYAALVSRKIGLGRMRIRYDYTESKRTIQDLYRNAELSVPWNEPYRFEVGLDLIPMRHTVVLARWRSSWGRKWGYRQAYYDFLGAHLNDLDALLEDMRANGVSPDAVRRVERQVGHYDLTHPESHGLPPIHQLDLSVAYSIPFERIALQIRADLINVFDSRNTAEWRFELDEESYFGLDEPGTSGLLNRANRPLLPRVFTLAAKVTW
ncbi:MAG: carboxypeptidase regulatory-like domain-containing protein [Bacteroidetes bacterium]|nr:carboxypeptidase regulatory-like domain-containing protein [Bacteroidota bacterium]